MGNENNWTEQSIDDLPEFQDDVDDDDEYEDDDEPEDDDSGSVTESVNDGHLVSWEEVINAQDTTEEKYFVPEWGGNILVKGLTKREFDYMRRQSKLKTSRGRSNEILERELTIAGIVQPRLDIPKYNMLLEKNAGVMVRILNKIMEKSGLADEAEEVRERRFSRKR